MNHILTGDDLTYERYEYTDRQEHKELRQRILVQYDILNILTLNILTTVGYNAAV